MNITKENKGVTIAALIITVIIILIIAGTTTYIGIDNIQKTQDELLLTELEQVKHFVGEAYFNYLKVQNESFLVGTVVSDETVQALISPENIIEIPEKYYEFDETSGQLVKKSVAKYRELTPNDLYEIGVEECRNTYIVNYLTGETFNKTQQTTSTGYLLYSYTRDVFDNNDVTAF